MSGRTHTLFAQSVLCAQIWFGASDFETSEFSCSKFSLLVRSLFTQRTNHLLGHSDAFRTRPNEHQIGPLSQANHNNANIDQTPPSDCDRKRSNQSDPKQPNKWNPLESGPKCTCQMDRRTVLQSVASEIVRRKAQKVYGCVRGQV